MTDGDIMRRVAKMRSMTPAQAALAGRMKNYKGRTCGKISTYKAGCHCPDCTAASRAAAERQRRAKGVKPRSKG